MIGSERSRYFSRRTQSQRSKRLAQNAYLRALHPGPSLPLPAFVLRCFTLEDSGGVDCVSCKAVATLVRLGAAWLKLTRTDLPARRLRL